MKRLILLLVLFVALPLDARVSGSRSNFGVSGLTIANTGCLYIRDDNGVKVGVVCMDSNDDLTLGDGTGVDNINLNTVGAFTVTAGSVAGDLVGKQCIPVDILSMRPTVTAPAGWHQSVEGTAGRPNQTVMDFADGADSHVQFKKPFTNAWDRGTLTFRVHWTTTATDTDGVAWALQAVAISDGDPIDTPFGTPVVVTDDAIGAAGDELVTAESTALTIAGSPADGDMTYFDFYRDVDDGNDDMIEKARLISIDLCITTDALNDD